MSDRPQPGLPFGFGEFGQFGQFDLAEIMRQMQSEGPLNFEVARQVATWVAGQAPQSGRTPGSDLTDAGSEAPPDAGSLIDPEALAELVRLAHIHVQEATGLGAGLEARVHTVTPTGWALETLDDLAPVLTALAERLTDSGEGGDGPEEPDAADLMGLMTAMAPMLLGMQAGFMVGHLSTLTLGRYEMPLPLTGNPRVSLVATNLETFGRDWALPGAELGLYVALHEVVHASLHSVEWVHRRVIDEAEAFVSAFDVDPRLIEDRLGAINPMDPAELEQAFGDPAELLGALRSPDQQRAQQRLGTTTALLEGFADAVLSHVGRGLIPSFDRIREASHRHRVERGEATRFLEALLGFDVTREAYERASAFWSGVVERAGADGLRLMWTSRERFPTGSELDAPGLWLERIRLPAE